MEKEEKERIADAKAMKDYEMICIKYKGTVYPITDDEWSTIFHCYCGYYDGMMTLRRVPILFAQYVKELLKLKIAEKKRNESKDS